MPDETIAAPAGADLPADIGLIAEGETPTPEVAASRIKNVALNPAFQAALMDGQHPAHDAAAAQWDQLHRIAAGTIDGDVDDGTADPVDGLEGAPSDPKKYELEKPPHGQEIDTELEQNAREWFHEAGIDAPAALTISHFWNERAANPPSEDQINSELDATAATLREEWGDNYEVKVQKAHDLMDKFPEAAHLLHVTGLDVNVNTIRALVRAAERAR